MYLIKIQKIIIYLLERQKKEGREIIRKGEFKKNKYQKKLDKIFRNEIYNY